MYYDVTEGLSVTLCCVLATEFTAKQPLMDFELSVRHFDTGRFLLFCRSFLSDIGSSALGTNRFHLIEGVGEW